MQASATRRPPSRWWLPDTLPASRECVGIDAPLAILRSICRAWWRQRPEAPWLALGALPYLVVVALRWLGHRPRWRVALVVALLAHGAFDLVSRVTAL